MIRAMQRRARSTAASDLNSLHVLSSAPPAGSTGCGWVSGLLPWTCPQAVCSCSRLDGALLQSKTCIAHTRASIEPMQVMTLASGMTRASQHARHWAQGSRSTSRGVLHCMGGPRGPRVSSTPVGRMHAPSAARHVGWQGSPLLASLLTLLSNPGAADASNITVHVPSWLLTRDVDLNQALWHALLHSPWLALGAALVALAVLPRLLRVGVQAVRSCCTLNGSERLRLSSLCHAAPLSCPSSPVAPSPLPPPRPHARRGRHQVATRVLLGPLAVAALAWLAISHPQQAAHAIEAALEAVQDNPVAASASLAVVVGLALGPAVFAACALAGVLLLAASGCTGGARAAPKTRHVRSCVSAALRAGTSMRRQAPGSLGQHSCAPPSPPCRPGWIPATAAAGGVPAGWQACRRCDRHAAGSAGPMDAAAGQRCTRPRSCHRSGPSRQQQRRARQRVGQGGQQRTGAGRQGGQGPGCRGQGGAAAGPPGAA